MGDKTKHKNRARIDRSRPTVRAFVCEHHALAIASSVTPGRAVRAPFLEEAGQCSFYAMHDPAKLAFVYYQYALPIASLVTSGSAVRAPLPEEAGEPMFAAMHEAAKAFRRSAAGS